MLVVGAIDSREVHNCIRTKQRRAGRMRIGRVVGGTGTRLRLSAFGRRRCHTGTRPRFFRVRHRDDEDATPTQRTKLRKLSFFLEVRPQKRC